jgi:hypothetical protein
MDQLFVPYEIWGFHDGENVDYGLMGCDIV